MSFIASHYVLRRHYTVVVISKHLHLIFISAKNRKWKKKKLKNKKLLLCNLYKCFAGDQAVRKAVNCELWCSHKNDNLIEWKWFYSFRFLSWFLYIKNNKINNRVNGRWSRCLKNRAFKLKNLFPFSLFFISREKMFSFVFIDKLKVILETCLFPVQLCVSYDELIG